MKPITVVRQRHAYDCGTATLAMLLGLSYGDVAAAVRKVVGEDKRNGTTGRDLQRAAKLLGRKLRPVRRRADYLDGAAGILGVLPNKGSDLPKAGHWVIYNGVGIVDTDDTVYPMASDYFRRVKARPCTLLVES